MNFQGVAQLLKGDVLQALDNYEAQRVHVKALWLNFRKKGVEAMVVRWYHFGKSKEQLWVGLDPFERLKRTYQHRAAFIKKEGLSIIDKYCLDDVMYVHGQAPLVVRQLRSLVQGNDPIYATPDQCKFVGMFKDLRGGASHENS